MSTGTLKLLCVLCAVCIVGSTIATVMVHRDIADIKERVNKLERKSILVDLARSEDEDDASSQVLPLPVAAGRESGTTIVPEAKAEDKGLSVDARLDALARWVKDELARQETAARAREAEIENRVRSAFLPTVDISEERFKELFNKKMKEQKAKEKKEGLESWVSWTVNDLATALNLQTSQKEEIARIVKEKFEKMMDLWYALEEDGEESAEGGKIDFATIVARQREIANEFRIEVDRHLSSSQSAAFGEWLKRNPWLYGDYVGPAGDTEGQ